MRLAPIIEDTMLHLDNVYYDYRDAGTDPRIIENMIQRCERLVDRYQRSHDCPCGGVVNVRTAKGIVSEHTNICVLGG